MAAGPDLGFWILILNISSASQQGWSTENVIYTKFVRENIFKRPFIERWKVYMIIIALQSINSLWSMHVIQNRWVKTLSKSFRFIKYTPETKQCIDKLKLRDF